MHSNCIFFFSLAFFFGPLISQIGSGSGAAKEIPVFSHGEAKVFARKPRICEGRSKAKKKLRFSEEEEDEEGGIYSQRARG